MFTFQNIFILSFTWSWLRIDAEAELLFAFGLWLLVDEADDDNTKELSELSELGLGADVSTGPPDPPDASHLVDTATDAADDVVTIRLLWNLLLETLALVQ